MNLGLPPSQVRCLRVLVVATCLAWLPVARGHGHINAGATAHQPGAPLYFANAGSWDAASGALIHLRLDESTSYGRLYLGGGDVTFTSLPATADNGGPDPRAALPGARLEMVLVSLDGPAGGSLSFWESDGFFDATEIRFTVPTSTTQGTNRIVLSENDGSPGADPYGHIHGRRFSVNVPGLYTVGLRLIDTAGHGEGGGPLHAASEIVSFHFQAGTTLQVEGVSTGNARFQFGTEVGRSYRVEASRALGKDTDWRPVTEAVVGTGRLEQLPMIPETEGIGFFRLRVE